MSNLNFKKLIPVLLISLLACNLQTASLFASNILWPGSMNMNNDALDLDSLLPPTATSSGSKKGFCFTGDPNEIFTLGAGHITINILLTGAGHTYFQMLEGLKKRGIKITAVICNDKVPVGLDTSEAPFEYRQPYFYMIDFKASNGEWQYYNFNRMVEDYGDYVDNWIIGNEINSQLYNYYGPSDVETYTKVYCDNFKICYDKIKEKNPDADVYISFDQGWDLPEGRKGHTRYNPYTSQYRYNAIEQLNLINKYLGKDVDWGLAIHPYPAPVGSSKFWDDEYAGYNAKSTYDKERPCYLVLKNLDFAVNFMLQSNFLRKDGTIRNIIISEFGLTVHDGERIQAAALYFLWEKIRDNPYIKCFLYNSQMDLDEFEFGLSDVNGKKRLAWAVFKDMDREYENAWCKDLLDDVLSETNYVDFNGILITKASASELMSVGAVSHASPH